MSALSGIIPWNPSYSAGWHVDGADRPEFYELFRGEDSEVRSRQLLIENFTWMACDIPDKKVADYYWDAADWLVRFGLNKEFNKSIEGIYYWRHRVTISDGGGDVHSRRPV